MEKAFTIHKRFVEQAAKGYDKPKGKERPTTRLWALAEQAATITSTTPHRWLKYGEWTLERALNDMKDKQGVKNKAAMFTWLVKHFYQPPGKTC